MTPFPIARRLGGIRLLGIAGILAASPHAGADWPAARGGNGRTAATDATPAGELRPAWTVPTGTPEPAWAHEARGSLWQKIGTPFLPRAADDAAPVPILHGTSVIVGTTRGELIAVDTTTGRRRWRVVAGGPIRYAPAAVADRVVFGADDGRVRAVHADTGAVLWETRVGPESPWISGNGRLISPHPIRTGLVIEDATVYATAGLFPLEHTYLAGLDLKDGHTRWRRDLGDHSPQGYLATAGPDLIVPAGRAAPRVYRRSDGTFRRRMASANGTLAVVADGETFGGPGATGTLSTQESPEARVVTYPGRQLAVTRHRSYLLNDRELLVLNRNHLRTHPGDIAGAIAWRHAVPEATALIVAGTRVFVAAPEGIHLLDGETGDPTGFLPTPEPAHCLAANHAGLAATTASGRLLWFASTTAATGDPATNDTGREPVPTPATRLTTATPSLSLPAAMPLPRGWGLWCPGTRDPAAAEELFRHAGFHWVLAVPPGSAASWRRRLADDGRLGTRASVVETGADGRVPVASHLFNVVLAEGLATDEVLRLTCPAPAGWILQEGAMLPAPDDKSAGTWTHQYGDAANSAASSQPLMGSPRLRWFGGHGPEAMPDRHTRGHAPLAAGGLLLSVAENGLIATDAHNGTVRWQIALPDSMRYALPYDAGYIVLSESGHRAWAAVDAHLWEIDTQDGAVVSRTPSPVAGCDWGWVARDGDRLVGSACRPTAPRTRKEYDLVDLEYRSERPLVLARALFRIAPSTGTSAWVAETEGAWVQATLALSGGRVYGVEALGPTVRADATGRLPCADLLEDARVVCLDADTGRRLWERPLEWPEARDILGLAVAGNRLLLSCARSVDRHAAYHLRCWNTEDGTEIWRADGQNPIEDLFHGQQVKRPVVAGDKVSFESDLFDLATGRRWIPPGAAPDWILRRPGHACGGMTGTRDGLLFRADNPTFFRFADGSFTRLSPTRPGCWLNILPAAGGILIPEASASCICGYPLQTSMGFAVGGEPAPALPDLEP